MAKKKKKRKAKIVALNPVLSPAKYIRTAARKLPIYKTLVSENILDVGMGYAIVIRQKRNEDKVLAVYLLDIWCLGVKDTFFRMIPAYEFDDALDDMFNSLPYAMIETDPTYTFNLVYGAVEYAEDLGLSPHKDFLTTRYILDDVNSFDFIDIEFGKNGRPCYVPGPDDHSGKIVSILNKHIGRDAYDYDELYIGEEEEEGFIEEVVADILTEKEDKEEYVAYLSILIVVTELFNEDQARLMDLFINDHTTLQKEVSENMNMVADGVIDDIVVPLEILLAIVEKYLIYEGPEFIKEEEFIEGFDSKPSKFDAWSVVSNVILYNFGRQKINKLFSLLAVLIAPDESIESQKEIILADKRSLRLNFDKMLERLDGDVFFTLDHIIMHEEVFGAIKEEDIEISKVENL